MRSTRRVLAAAVAAVFACGLAACGSSGHSAGGDSSGPIKIGIVIPMSGPIGSTSVEYQAVAKNLTKKIPGTSTIDGRKVEVSVQDDQGTAAGTSTAVRKLIDQEGVDLILGPLYTTEADAALPLTNRAKLLNIVFTGCPDCGNGTKYPYVFSVEADRPSQAPPTIARMKQLGVKKLAMLESDDPTGQAYADAIGGAAKKAGIDVVKTVHFAPNTLDLGTQASQLKAADADAVYLATAVPTDVANAAKAMKEINYEPEVFGNASAPQPVVVAAAGADWLKHWSASGYGKNTIGPNPTPAAVKFRDLLKRLEGVSTLPTPVNLSAGVMDAFDMAKAAIEATHTTDGPTLATWLEKHDFPNGIKVSYTFTNTAHNGVTANVQGLVQPGTLHDGFPLPAGSGS